MEAEFFKYGIAGIVIVAMGYYILKKDKEHADREKEWRETIDNITDKMDKRQQETNNITRENTNILSGLKTLLENKK